MPLLSPSSLISKSSMASSSFLSPPQLIPTPKFSPPLQPPSSVTFRQPSLIYASHSSTAQRITSPSSLYEVLGINIGATSQEIKSAYRKLARLSHPDVAINGRNDLSAADEFVRINAAYATLSDPGKRVEYDRTLFPRQRRMNDISTSTASRYSGYTTSRNWETDQCW